MIESLGLSPISQSADTVKNIDENKNNYSDIICTSYTPYFPPYFLGEVIERYTTTIDYMVGMGDFEEVFKELGVDSNYFKRESKIYNVLDTELLESIGMLSDDDITIIGNNTNRVESSLYTTVGFDVYVMKHLQQYHIQDMLNDIERGVIHKFIQLNYNKTNLMIHLYPFKCMEEKNIPYDEAMSYCISVMWATLINIVYKRVRLTNAIDLLSEVFYRLNPILTKMVICTNRTLTPNGYSFVQEFEQLTSTHKFIQFKTAPNHIINRWSPRSDRFENFMHKFYRTETNDWDGNEDVADVRRDSNGTRFLEFDCKIKDSALATKVTILGQNIMRDVTGYYTTPIYGLICDDEILEHYELSSLFVILTGTKEHRELFERNLMKSYMDVKSGKVKFISQNTYNGVSLTVSKPKQNKHLKSLIDIMGTKDKDYTGNMVALAVRRTNKQVFLNLKPDNNYYIATQLIQKFDMRRNVPKDIMDVIRKSRLSDEDLEESLELVERHKRPKIREMVEFVKTLEPPKHIIHEIYNYLWNERYI